MPNGWKKRSGELNKKKRRGGSSFGNYRRENKPKYCKADRVGREGGGRLLFNSSKRALRLSNNALERKFIEHLKKNEYDILKISQQYRSGK